MAETDGPQVGDGAPPQKSARPRDEFGRPLARDAENRLQLANFDALSVEENHRLGVEYFNAGSYFGAHEAWETAWRMAKGSDDEELFKGLSQLGAGYTHYQRGNPIGACALLRRGAGRIRAYAPARHGLDLDALVRAAEAHIGALEPYRRGDELPQLTLLRL